MVPQILVQRDAQKSAANFRPAPIFGAICHRLEIEIPFGRSSAYSKSADEKLAPRTRRLIERLLDQVDAQGRLPTESEDTFLRRAIDFYQAGAHKDAIEYAFRASKVGDMPIAFVLDEPDRTIPLRMLLANVISM